MAAITAKVHVTNTGSCSRARSAEPAQRTLFTTSFLPRSAKLQAATKNVKSGYRRCKAEAEAPKAEMTMEEEMPLASMQLEEYGRYCFKGAVADQYLSKYGETSAILDTPEWTYNGKAETVAAALKDWAIDCGATSFCHLFQPMGASGVRHGQTACVQMSMLSFAKDGTASWEFDADDLLTGETDGSSYPNGGMRATHTAGGYLAVDPVSPVFCRDDVMFIPAAFIAYTGQALDEKTPLHRACEVLSKEGARLLGHMGVEASGIVNNIGLEQEIFLVPRDAFYARPDLQFTGRTVMGHFPARGQEMSDHYMAPLTTSTSALACMKAIQEECYKLGIPLKTRHREVAPNQYEFAPLFGDVRVQTDQNLMVMQIIEETAAKYGLAALLQEKPFSGINGSGKHNNWSFATNEGLQLLNPKMIMEKTSNADLFPIIMAAVVSGIDKHGDLLRLAIASPGNDFRLGAMEAPPAVMSTYLGASMTTYLESFAKGEACGAYAPDKAALPFGVSTIQPMMVPAEDRNRTSPFPYGGNRFEFRAAGSSQNVSLINTVLNTATAEGFKIISDRVEAGETAVDVAKDLLSSHMKVVFNGNGYDPAWPEEAVKAGIWRIDSGVEAICELTSAKNVELLGTMGILSAEECEARKCVLLEHYTGVVEMEANTMKDMILTHVIPSCKKSAVPKVSDLESCVETLEKAVSLIHAAADEEEAAKLARVLRLETMNAVRDDCDSAEAACKEEDWTLATYKEMLFLDSHTAFGEEYEF